MKANEPIVFYDGHCALCHFAVQWLLKRDRNQVLKFAPIGGTAYGRLRTTPKVDSVVLIIGDRFFTQSEAVMEALKLIGGFYWQVKVASLCPAFIRNAVYRLVAANRRQWFGRTEGCIIPPAHQRHQFLD